MTSTAPRGRVRETSRGLTTSIRGGGAYIVPCRVVVSRELFHVVAFSIFFFVFICIIFFIAIIKLSFGSFSRAFYY